jgi:hypothetical protein
MTEDQPNPNPKIQKVRCSIHIQCQKSNNVGLLDWIGFFSSVQPNPRIQPFWIVDIGCLGNPNKNYFLFFLDESRKPKQKPKNSNKK